MTQSCKHTTCNSCPGISLNLIINCKSVCSISTRNPQSATHRVARTMHRIYSIRKHIRVTQTSPCASHIARICQSICTNTRGICARRRRIIKQLRHRCLTSGNRCPARPRIISQGIGAGARCNYCILSSKHNVCHRCGKGRCNRKPG